MCIALIEDKPYGILAMLDEYCALGGWCDVACVMWLV
jgi:myosin heavy subunit